MTSYEIEPIEFDTAGHSLLGVELGRTMNQDRERETAKLVQDSSRVRDAHSRSRGGILSWFGRHRGHPAKAELLVADRVEPQVAP
jgi:hypothetical protein